MNYQDLNQFTKAYIDAMLWTECLDDIDLRDKGFYDLAPETLARIIKDCNDFELSNKNLLDQVGSPDQHGHDFWLSRNNYGVGFFDRGYGKIGLELSQICEDNYRPLYLVLGDDNLLYIEG